MPNNLTEPKSDRNTYVITCGFSGILLADNGTEKPVLDGFCRDDRPETAQVCKAACDTDCTLSQWTEWSECKVHDCELYVRQRRNNEDTGK